MKKIFGIITILLALSSLSALDTPFFSGYTGIIGDFTSNESSNSFDPMMTTQAFVSGQFDFNGKFFIRGELYLKTADILDKGLFEETDSKFKINELSFTFHQKAVSTSHFISLFLGNYEPIGSDMFLQRQFGIKPISSPVTENWTGLYGSSVYPFYGVGGSYVIHFENPFAIGLYAFAVKDDDTDENVFNTDLRFACVFRNFALDFSAGLAFPHEKSITETGEDVVLLIRTETIHAGLNMLIGNRYSASLFIQAGFSNLKLEPENDSKLNIDSDDIYLFVEPRVMFRQFQLSIALFSLPEKSISDMIYLHDTFGANICVMTDKLYFSNTNFTFGIHTSFSFPEKTFMDVKDNITSILSWDRNLYVTPFTSVPFLGGTLKASVSINCLELATNWMSSIKGAIGFKTNL